MHCPFGHPVSIMLPIYLYKMVKFLNGINTKHKAAWKKYWTMVFNRIAVHMQKFGQIRATSKNGLKFDIGRLCSQPFNFSDLNFHNSRPKFSILARKEKALFYQVGICWYHGHCMWRTLKVARFFRLTPMFRNNSTNIVCISDFYT